MRPTRGSSRLVVSLLALLAIVIVWFAFLSGLLSSSSTSTSSPSTSPPNTRSSFGTGNLDSVSANTAGLANVPKNIFQADFRNSGRWSAQGSDLTNRVLTNSSGSPLGKGLFPSGTLEGGLQPVSVGNGGQNAAADVDEFDWSRASQSLPCDLADALQWQPHLPAAALRRAVSYKGDMLRLDMFLYKLVVQRLPVTVAVVGGPVTFLSAGHRGPQPVMFNQGLYGTTGERSHSPQQGWLASALDNLVRAFPPRHLKQWRVPGQSESAVVAEPYWLINLGLPRGSLATWASCDGATFLQSLPDDMDLVIAELALSDQGEAKGQGPASFLQMYDTILQHLLLRWGGGSPQTPPQMRQGREGKEGGLDGVKAVAGAAVVLVNFFSFCRGNRACREAEDPSLSFSDVGPFSFGLPPHHPAYPHSAPETVSEDNTTVLAQYYSLPVLSTRDAFYTLLGQQASGYRLKDIATTGPSNLPLHVEPHSLASAIPPAAVAPDTADDSYGTAAGGGAGSGPADYIDPVDLLALAGALPTAQQARTKYADVITALFHSALTGKSACPQHLSIMAFESDLKVTTLTGMRLVSSFG
ncbi:unnamed protein product [Closterium sp. NIES-54]